jgi:hypothetical protein
MVKRPLPEPDFQLISHGMLFAYERPLCAAGSIGQRNTLIFYQRWSVDMKQRRRIYYSAAQRSEIWDRWQAGEPMSSIGRRF